MSGFGLGFGFAYVRSILSRVAATEIFTANTGVFSGTTVYLGGNNDKPLGGAGDFHVSIWVKFSSTAGDQILIDNWTNSATTRCFELYKTSAGHLAFHHWFTGGAEGLTTRAIPILNTTTWTHLAAERVGGDLFLYQDGVQIGASEPIGTTTLYDIATTNFTIGALADNPTILEFYGSAVNACVARSGGLVSALYHDGAIPCWEILNAPTQDAIIAGGRFWPIENHTGFTGQERIDQTGNTGTIPNNGVVFTGTAQIECEEYVPSVNDMLMTIDTTQAGSASDTFIFPLTSMGGLASIQIAWGDGSSSVITAVGQAELTHVYAVGGTYDMFIIGAVGYEWLTSGATDKAKIITITYSPNTTVIDLFNRQASSLTTVTGVPSLGISLRQVWQQSTSLTSIDFTGWDTSLISDWFFTFEGCTSLVSLPILDLTAITNASNTWLNCALDTTSIDNIMQSLVNSGKASLTTSVAGGTSLGFASWSAGAVTNYNTLISNGWTIATNA